jgi:uncharacterized C2H2 Zn-finger protein
MKYADKIEKLGFKDAKEYRDHLARSKGYKDFNDERQAWRKFKKSVKCESKLLSEML